MNRWKTFFRPEIRLNLYLIIASCWLGPILNFSFLKKLIILSDFHGFAAVLFAISMSFVLTSYMYFILGCLAWRWNAKWLVLLLIFIGGGSSYFCNMLGIAIDANQIQNALQTDQREVKDLFSLDLCLWLLGFSLIPMLLLGWIRIRPETFVRHFIQKVITLTTCLIITAGLVFFYYLDLSSTLRTHRELRDFISPQNTIHALWSYHSKHEAKKSGHVKDYGTDAKHVASTHPPKLLLLVVGETARAESFSLNGYARNTNPELSQLPIINYNNVSSCGTATAISVPCMFSGLPRLDYDEQTAYARENLLDILKRAGYHVTWIDNDSGCKDVCDRIDNYTISKALQDKWCADGECLDDMLLDALKDYLQHLPANDTTPRVIVLHQMGSHGPAYYKRTPAEFRHFMPICDTNAIQDCARDTLINVYDNTIVYTDHFLAEAIHILDKSTATHQSMLWYLSDHGESTGEHGLYLHGAPYVFAPSQQTHIPMLMWLSPKWQTFNPQQQLCLTQQQHHDLSQDNLFPTILGLLDVKTQVKNPALDMTEQCKVS